MTLTKMLYLLAVIAIAVIAYIGWKMTSRDAYETAEYTVLETDGVFELRAYPDLMLVSTPMNFQDQGNDGSFGRLFNYISGENAGDRKVSMTTPVFMDNAGPESEGQMGFVIPQEVAANGTPDPTSGNVHLRKRTGGKFAVLRFSGRINQASRVEMERKLREWMDRTNLVGESGAEFAGYDPPWTPGPFRRNEVLVRLK